MPSGVVVFFGSVLVAFLGLFGAYQKKSETKKQRESDKDSVEIPEIKQDNEDNEETEPTQPDINDGAE